MPVRAGQQLNTVGLRDVEDNQMRRELNGGFGGAAAPGPRPPLKLPEVQPPPGRARPAHRPGPGPVRRPLLRCPGTPASDPCPAVTAPAAHPSGRTAQGGNRRSWPPSPGRRATPRPGQLPARVSASIGSTGRVSATPASTRCTPTARTDFLHRSPAHGAGRERKRGWRPASYGIGMAASSPPPP